MSEKKIRRMTLADVPAVQAIESAVFPRPWTVRDFEREMTVNRCARYLVGEEDGRIIGYAGAWIVLDEAQVTNVAVAEEYRGRGWGRALMEALLQYAANLGAVCVTLEVRKSNETAQNLYRSLGFFKVSVRKKYYEDNGEDGLLMVLDRLPPAQEDFEEAETVYE